MRRDAIYRVFVPHRLYFKDPYCIGEPTASVNQTASVNPPHRWTHRIGEPNRVGEPNHVYEQITYVDLTA